MGNSFRERLISARKSAGMTQAEAAKRLGTTQPAYAKYETGPSLPGLEKLLDFCRLYGVSSDYLLGLSDDPKATRAVSIENGSANAVNSAHAHIETTVPQCRDCPHLLRLIDILERQGGRCGYG